MTKWELDFGDNYVNFDKIPSPDCSENPFLKKKDCNGKLETASDNTLNNCC